MRRAILAAAGLALAPAVVLAAYRLVPPPVTPLMLIRLVQGHGLAKDWTALDHISPNLADAAIAAEDNRFCSHVGFDWNQLAAAIEEYQAGDDLRGASTISMQTAKNLFLWPGRSFIRKGVEAYLTVLVEALLPKRRILELYLNIDECGPGIYGAEAAARHWFRKPAVDLSPREAALLAAVLPSPLRFSPAAPSGYVARRASVIGRRVGQLGPLLACVRS